MARPKGSKNKATRTAQQEEIDAAALLDEFKGYSAIDVVSRRLNDPHEIGSLPIMLADEDPDCCSHSDHQQRVKVGERDCKRCGRPNRRWYVRWSNTAVPGRFNNMRAQGYIPVRVSELRAVQDVSDMVSGPSDDYVRRGDRGQEVLHKIPLPVKNHLTNRRLSKINVNNSSVKRMQDSINEATAAAFGERAHVDGGIRLERFKRTQSDLHTEVEAGAAEREG